MAMTLRLTEQETAALREYARATGSSMQDVARKAITDLVAERASKRDAILRRIVAEDTALLDLLLK